MGPLWLGALPAQAQVPGAPDGRDALLQTVRQWVAHHQQSEPNAVELAPLDPRLQLPLCAAGWQVDLPFASISTVRARCASPQAQYYLRVLNANPPQTAVAPPAQTNTPAAEPSATATRQVLVTTRSLQRGMRLLPEHMALAEVDAQGLAANTLQLLDEALNAEASRDLRAGEPLRSSDIRQALLVKRGQVVLLQLQAQSGFLITARVEALQDGRMGEQIKLKNMESGRMLTGVVNGLNSARGL